MVCPQCGAEVPSDDAFCGKCGYAMREGAPERVDQSRIRVHEEPDPVESPAKSQNMGSAQQRVRKATMVGMPALTPSQSPEPPVAREAPPPTEISAARERAKKRTPQKTMLGIPRPDVELPNETVKPDESAAAPQPSASSEPVAAPPPPPTASGEAVRPARARSRVRYDSANESFPMLQRRKKALRGLAVLVALAAAWFAYRFLTLNG